jgi:hypothetical protein
MLLIGGVSSCMGRSLHKIEWVTLSAIPSILRVQNCNLRVQTLNLRVQSCNFQVQTSTLRVQTSKPRVQGSKLRAKRSKCRVQRLKCRVQRSKLRVQRSKCRVQRSKCRVPSLEGEDGRSEPLALNQNGADFALKSDCMGCLCFSNKSCNFTDGCSITCLP